MTGRISRLAIAGLVFVASSAALYGQNRPAYRDFVLGSGLSSVAAQVGVMASDATVVHARPALIQELRWRLPYFLAGSNQPQTDPVEQIVFGFYNDRLFRLAIDYDRQRTEGLTDADMIGSLSEAYGPAQKSTPRPPAASRIDVPISRWATDEYSIALLRSTFGDGFRVVVTSTKLAALASAAEAEALRLDLREAPQRAIDQQKKDADAALASGEKARNANKAAFRP